jgi:TonB family protein
MTLALPRLEPAPPLRRVMTWSFAIHVGLVIALFVVPREWLVRRADKPPVMTISIGGSTGPRTTGTNPIGGRTVEQVAPPAKRPEPVRPAPKPAAPPPVPAKPTPPPPPRTAATAKPAPAPPKPAPVTGPQVTRGSTPVETGARGQGSGLTFEGGPGTGGETNLQDFCCPQYLSYLLATIESEWDQSGAAGLRGVTVIRFVVERDGRISEHRVTESSGRENLDRLARRALLNVRQFRPLPAEYTEKQLIIHLKFPYGGS